MIISELQNLSLPTLQSTYGGSIQNDTLAFEHKILGTVPVIVSVYRNLSDATDSLISFEWDGLVLILGRDIHIPSDMAPVKVRWFSEYLKTIDPELSILIQPTLAIS